MFGFLNTGLVHNRDWINVERSSNQLLGILRVSLLFDRITIEHLREISIAQYWLL